MKKILVLFIMIFMFSASAVFASEISADLPAFDVTFNGTEIQNENRQFPLLVYKDITYVPMTYYDCRFLGLVTDWNNETTTLSIEKENITCAYRSYEWQWENPNKNQASVCSFNITVNGKEIDNSKEEYPLLIFRDVTYFPLTWYFAVEEFGWEYHFDAENGLSIISDNYHAETLELPNVSGNAATDGEYYYYNGIFDGKRVVYRVPVSDTSNPTVIHELTETPLSIMAAFMESDGDICFKYTVGYSPIMSSVVYYRINGDGTVTAETPNRYSDGSHGSSEVFVRENGIAVKGKNPYFDSATVITYEKDGVITEVPALPGRVRIGRRRNGMDLYGAAAEDCIQIFGGKIYYTAIELDGDSENSALYCIDTAEGVAEKLIDGVCGFYVYNGWLNEEQSDSTMILYDKNGCLMRYSELNKSTIQVRKYDTEDGLMLENAAGEYFIYTVRKSILGDRTVVEIFGGYADNNASISSVLLDTTTGTYNKKFGDRLCVYTAGEAPGEEIRLLVPNVNPAANFCSSDAVSDVFIYENILLYRIGESTIVRVDLKE